MSALLRGGGLSFHDYVGRRFNVGFLAHSCIVAAFAAVAMLLASTIDGSLVLSGRSVGLLEHPAIWAFLVLQVALPLSIRQSLKQLIRARALVARVVAMDRNYSELMIQPVRQFLQLEDKESRGAATILYCVGLIAFVWNTYQNQLPRVIVPYDFWDSKTFLLGFIATRVYKLYLFVWLLPYIALIHVAVLFVTLRMLRRSRVAGRLKLIAFHRDGVGGLGFVPGLVTRPIIVAILAGSIPTAAAFEVHRTTDVTPLMGLSILIASTCIAYLVPVLFLRADIVAVKLIMIGKIRSLQQTYYSRGVESNNFDIEALRNGNEALEYFEKVLAAAQSISHYPHLKRLLGYVGLALTPTALSLTLKLLEVTTPLLNTP